MNIFHWVNGVGISVRVRLSRGDFNRGARNSPMVIMLEVDGGYMKHAVMWILLK